MNAAKIKERREALRLTQKKAAEIVGVHVVSWQRWEADTRKMHPAMWELFQRKTQRRRK